MDNTQEEKEKPVSKQPHKPPKRITRSHGKVYPDKKESKRKHTKKSKEEKKNETSEDPTEHNDKIDGDTTKAETEKKPKHSHCIKKQNFLQSDDEIRSQIALAQQYLSKRKTVTLPRDTIITTSRKLEPKQSVDDKILDLRTHLSTVTIPVSQLPPQIQKHPQPPYSVQKLNRPKYKFPHSDKGFDTIEQYKAYKLNADLQELEAMNLIIKEIDKALDSYNSIN